MPQRFYEKEPDLGQKKVEHLDSFLLLSHNTKSFALHILAKTPILCPPTPMLPTPCSLCLLNFSSTSFFLVVYSNKPSQNASTHFSSSVHFVTPPKLLKHTSSLPLSKDRVCKLLMNFFLTCLTKISP